MQKAFFTPCRKAGNVAPVPPQVGKLTNHLGNVLAVITDRKRGLAASGTDIQ
ncbi:MAG: hypothetical protein H6569_09430 [Lewinellaceae bacterium]|nr:hypothetical protein [Lewinellaceae bacterium]